MMRTAFASVLFALLAACGGGASSAPAPSAAGDEAPPPADADTCCCDYIAESGSEEDGTWAEDQAYERMSSAECADASGSCTDDAACAGGE